jgi:hypothetical protein
MKNFFLKFISVLLLTFLFISCGKKDNNGSVAGVNNLPSVDMKGEKVTLKYQFEKGQKYHYKLTTINNSNQTIVSDSTHKSEALQTLTYLVDLEVMDVDKENIAEMSITFANVNLDATIDGTKFKYDSKANNTKEDKQKFLKYEAEANFNYHAKVNQKGEVVEVTKIDKLVDKIIGLQGQNQPVPPQQKQQFVDQISQEEIRPITQLLFRDLPTKPLGKDSTWAKSIPVNLGPMQIATVETFKVEDFVKAGDYKAAKIGANVTFTVSGNKKGEQNGTSFTFEDPKVSGGGSIIFNFEKGYVVRSETISNVEVTVVMDAKNQAGKSVHAKRTEINMNKNIVELL